MWPRLRLLPAAAAARAMSEHRPLWFAIELAHAGRLGAFAGMMAKREKLPDAPACEKPYDVQVREAIERRLRAALR